MSTYISLIIQQMHKYKQKKIKQEKSSMQYMIIHTYI